MMDVGIPEGMNVSSTSEGLKIERKWFSGVTIFLTVFAVLWNGFLFNWYNHAHNFELFPEKNMLVVLVPLLFVAVGVVLTYYVIASYFNKTIITVNHRTLESKISPFPFGFKKSIPSRSIEQVYCKEITRGVNNDIRVLFEVRVILKNRSNITLFSGLESSEQALFLEHEIESYLGIKDVSVKGELS